MRAYFAKKGLIHVVVLVVFSHVICVWIGSIAELSLMFFPENIMVDDSSDYKYAGLARLDVCDHGVGYLKTFRREINRHCGVWRERPSTPCFARPGFFLGSCVGFHVAHSWLDAECTAARINDSWGLPSISESKLDLDLLTRNNRFMVCAGEANPRALFQLSTLAHLPQLSSHDAQLVSSKDRVEACGYCEDSSKAKHPSAIAGRWLRCRWLGWVLFSTGCAGLCVGWLCLLSLLGLGDWRRWKWRIVGFALLVLASFFLAHIGTGILIAYWD
jgi:hypothetical protein